MNSVDEWFEQNTLWKDLAPTVMIPEKLWKRVVDEVSGILNLVKLPEQSSILDLCCGNGRHTLEFAKLGFYVTGVDRTEIYLNEAKQKYHNSGIEEGKVSFIQSDMREYCQSDHFDMVVNMGNSFGYFVNKEDDKKVLKNVYESLKQDGYLLIQITGKEVLAKNFQPKNWYRENNKIIMLQKKIIDNWSCMEQAWTVIENFEKREYIVKSRIYSAVELASLAQECGFTSIQAFGNFDGSEYNQNAKTLILIAKK